MTDIITLSRSVVEQALEALKIGRESAHDCAETFHIEMAGYKQQRHEALDAEVKQISDAIGVLRAALEQPQVEQEPAAWIERWYGSGPERGWWIVCGRDHIAHLGPAEMSGEAASKIVSAHNTSPPAQRQPLTDAQINDHRLALPYDGEDLPDPWDFKQGVRAAERAHGIGGEA